MAPNPRFLELLKKIEDLHNRKNAGYSGAESKDALANFRLAAMFGVTPFQGVLVRLSDKFSRIASLTRNPTNEQVGENIKDTLMDNAVYSLLAICLYEEQETALAHEASARA